MDDCVGLENRWALTGPGGSNPPLSANALTARSIADATTVILVEGASDKAAVEAVAGRHGRRLAAEGTVVVAMGGAHAVGRVADRLADRPELRVTGLCDRGEASFFAAASIEFHSCDADLEDELIRCVDRSELERLLAAEGDLAAFRTLQKQGPWRDRSFPEQMHRWLRAGAQRNLRYAHLIPLTADVDRLPPPLVAVLG